MGEVMVRETFGEAVHRLLDGRKLTWLATRVEPGITYQRLWRITSSRLEPTLEEAAAVATAFEVPVGEVLPMCGACGQPLPQELLGDGADGDGLAPASIVGDAGEHGGGAGSPASPVAGSGRDVRATRVSRRPFVFAPHEVEGSGSLTNPESRP